MTARPQMKLLTMVFLVLVLPSSLLLPAAQAQIDSALVPKFVDELPRVCGLVPYTDHNGNPCLRMTADTTTAPGKDYYEVAAREKYQQILPSNQGFGSTKVWTFGPAGKPASSRDFHYPAGTIVATENRPVQVKWINDLKDSSGNFLPSFLPIDQGNHWANPPSVCERGDHQPIVTGPDCMGSGPNYAGPVPLVVHLHGSHAASESDGIPEAWWLPAANNIPSGYAKHGSDYCQVNLAGTRSCTYNNDGAALFQYPNDQFPATLFFHDHTLGITEQNVYAGLSGLYLLSDRGTGPHDVNTLPAGPYEIPLVIQDKSFNTDGSLFFTTSGNMMVVNGKTWPFLEVEPRKYRFRIVDGAEESFYSLSFEGSGDTTLKFTQIGGDAGFLPSPVTLRQIDITPGERVDMIVDFSGLQGSTLILGNNGGGDMGKVLQIRVDLPLQGTDTSKIPNTFPARAPLGTATFTRKVALFDSGLGIVTGGNAVQMPWDDPVTETPTLNTTEIWEIYNVSADAHPIHLHEVGFEVLDRQSIATGVKSPPSPGETGFKDTVLVNGGTITRIKARFDIPGLYAWHCHIIVHEDNQMMRPMCILDPNDPTGSAKCLKNP